MHEFVNCSRPETVLTGRLGRGQRATQLSRGVEKWVRKCVQRQSGSKRDALTQAIEKLEDIAEGKSGGGSWKGKLEASSSWDDAQHEAGYHLVIKVDETITRQLHEVMDEIFLELKAARSDLENMYQDMDEPR